MDYLTRRWLPMLFTQVAVYLIVWAVLFSPPRLQADVGEVVTAPPPQVKAKNGVKLNVDTTWVAGNGYRPVRVTISTAAAGTPAPADRTFYVEFRPRDASTGRDQELKVGQFVELAQGAASTQAVIAVPQAQPWTSWTMEVYEDGRELRELRLNTNTGRRNRQVWVDGAGPAILFIDGDAPANPGGFPPAGQFQLPDYRNLASFNPQNSNRPPMVVLALSTQRRVDDATLLRSLVGFPQLAILPPSRLPTRWIDYSSLDVVFCSLDDLADFQAKRPAAWRALRKWLAAGGTICVYDVGDKFERLAQLEQILKMPKRSNTASSSSFTARGWRKLSDWIVAQPPAGRQTPQRRSPNRTVRRPPHARSSIIQRPLQMGRVAAFEAKDPFPGDRNQWKRLFDAIDQKNLRWYQRHGVSLSENNRGFWDWLIAGVGLAPVDAFKVLITLFVIVIGPVNYYLLRKKRRLNWLLITVPVGAGAITLSLLAYALFHDGFGVRARVRSYTEIDQESGHVTSWSRQTYYAGVAPSAGLAFPADAAVYPIEQYRDQVEYRLRWAKSLEWSDEQQKLSRGYMRSREFAQFLVVRSSDKPKTRLNVLESPNGGPPEIENQLGARIQVILLVDSRGRFFWAKDVQPGQTVRLASGNQNEAQTALQDLIVQQPLIPPPGFNPNIHGRPTTGRRSYRRSRRSNNLPPADFGLSLMERRLVDARLMRFLRPRRSYIAILDAAPQAPLGVASAREEGSLHVIRGLYEGGLAPLQPDPSSSQEVPTK